MAVESVVEGFGTPAMAKALKRLGGRHIDYQATDVHFGVVGQALLNSFKDVLGDKFDDRSV